MLPERLGDAVGAAYLLMRIVDTLEDSMQLCDSTRAAALAGLAAEIDAVKMHGRVPDGVPGWSSIGDNEAEIALMAESPQVLETIARLPAVQRENICRCASTMIAGVSEMLARSARRGVAYPGIQEPSELRSYCYYVAGVVGEMLCGIMADYLNQPGLLRLHDVAVELGIGLQLVNILKDAVRDADSGRRYLPLTADGEVSASKIYRTVLEEARVSLLKGVEFVLALPATAWELRSFCGLPIAWGAMTLARAQRDKSRGKIGRGAVRASIQLFRGIVSDDQALRQWFAKMLAPRAPLPV
jgi:farnesyl-diphosphate farnesyltransferase